MVISFPFGKTNMARPETYGSIEEFTDWSGSYLFDFGNEAERLLSKMRIYPNRYGRVCDIMECGLQSGFYDFFRPYDTYRAEDGLKGLFNEFDKLGGGTYDDFIRFIVDKAMFGGLDRLGCIYRAQFFGEHGVPKGKPRREMKRRYSAIFHWVAENAARATLRPMYDAWVNEQKL